MVDGEGQPVSTQATWGMCLGKVDYAACLHVDEALRSPVPVPYTRYELGGQRQVSGLFFQLFWVPSKGGPEAFFYGGVLPVFFLKKDFGIRLDYAAGWNSLLPDVCLTTMARKVCLFSSANVRTLCTCAPVTRCLA